MRAWTWQDGCIAHEFLDQIEAAEAQALRDAQMQAAAQRGRI